ncbi:hypothetical protein AAY473_031044 [Plecturocebus cupreus]
MLADSILSFPFCRIIQPFKKYLLKAYCIPETGLGRADTAVNRKKQRPCFHETYVLFKIYLESCSVTQDGRQCFIMLARLSSNLASSDPPTSASQSAGITGVSHCARPKLMFILQTH